MFKKAVALISTIVMVVALGGCSSTKLQEVDGVTELKFKDTIKTSELKKIDSKKVSMIGFMSTSTPLNGEYTYLMNMPYQNCAFCVPNTDSLVNTIAVYAPEGKSFEFTDVPVRVTGTLEFGSTTDSMGYTYEYRIKDAKLEPADISNLEEDIKIYTALINQGFAEFLRPVRCFCRYKKKHLHLHQMLLVSDLTKMRCLRFGLLPYWYRLRFRWLSFYHTPVKPSLLKVLCSSFCSFRAVFSEEL